MNAGRRRATALLEVLGVYLVGPLVTAQLVRVLGLRLVNPFDHFTAGISDAGLITASRQMFLLLVLQYAAYFLLIMVCATPRHGSGVWAPSLRFHGGRFWIYYPFRAPGAAARDR